MSNYDSTTPAERYALSPCLEPDCKLTMWHAHDDYIDIHTTVWVSAKPRLTGLSEFDPRGFHALHRRSNTAPGSGQHAQLIGLRLGYWPCHRGPFISIELLSHRWDIWWGTPSFEKAEK